MKKPASMLVVLFLLGLPQTLKAADLVYQVPPATGGQAGGQTNTPAGQDAPQAQPGQILMRQNPGVQSGLPDTPGQPDTPDTPGQPGKTGQPVQPVQSGPPAQANQIDQEAMRLWQNAAQATQAQNWADAFPLWEKFLRAYPDEPRALFHASIAAVNLSLLQKTKEEQAYLQAAATNYLERLRKMPVDQNLRATASFYLLSIYANGNQLPKAEAVLKEMAKLGKSDIIRLEQAKGASNLIAYYGEAGKLEKAREIFKEMASLGEEPHIRDLRAAAAFNLITDYCKAGRLDEAKGLFKSLSGYGNSNNLKEIQANAAINLISGFARAGKLAEAREIFAAMPVETQGLKDHKARAAFNLVSYVTGDGPAAGQLETGMALLKELAACGDSPAVKEALSGAALKMVSKAAAGGKLDMAQAAFDLLPQADGPGLLRLERAEAAAALAGAYGQSGKLDKAEALYATLPEAGQQAALDELRSRAAFNLLCDYANAGQAEKAAAFLPALGDGTPAMRERGAKALVNLVAAYGEGGKLEKAQALLDESKKDESKKDESKKKENSEVEQGWLARAEFNLIWYLLAGGQYDAALNRFAGMPQNSGPATEERADAALLLLEAAMKNNKRADAEKMYSALGAMGNSEAVQQAQKKGAALLGRK